MNEMDYFQKLNAFTPTRFWVNNPTLGEARLAIAHGALGCTTNPSHLAKVLSTAEDGGWAREVVKQAASRANSEAEAAALAQRTAVARLAREFEPLYKASGGRHGYVSIQADPFTDDDPASIIREAETDLALAKNIIPKIPVTQAGLEAIAWLAGKEMPVLATEVMGLPQAAAVCETYRKAAKSGDGPFYVTHITGIFNEYLKGHAGGLPSEAMAPAGLAVARKQYHNMRQRGWPGTLMGGGVRDLTDFTDLVGADAVITINWRGTADKLLALDGPATPKIDEATGEEALHTLLKLDTFRMAWEEDGLAVRDFAAYGPVRLFRSMFVEGWQKLLVAVREAS